MRDLTFLLLFLAAAIYVWGICAGRRAAVVRVGSFFAPNDLWRRFMHFRPSGQPGMIGSQTFPTDHPLSLRTWQAARADAEDGHWRQVQADATRYGALLTFSLHGQCPPLVLMRFLAGSYWTGLKAGWFGVMPKASAAAAAERPGWAAKGPPPMSRRSRPAQSLAAFVKEHSREIMLSLLACASFALIYGFYGMLLLAPIILLHEYGHLLAYRLTGNIGGKIMLVPFFGGLAVADSPHKSEFDRAFCAIMGPAICLPVSVILTCLAWLAQDHWLWWWFSYGAMISAYMNALNLLPMLPLDGGHSFESLARSIAPSQASPAMLVLTVIGAAILYSYGEGNMAKIIGLWGVMSVAQSWNRSSRAKPLTARNGAVIALFHGGTFALHALCAASVSYWI